MWRFVLLAVIAWVGFSLVKRALIQRSPEDKSKAAPKTPDESAKNAEDMGNTENTENMVKCAHCGVHLPVSEAFLVKDVFYCSKAHLPTPHQ